MSAPPTIDVFESVEEGTELEIHLSSEGTPDALGATITRIGKHFARPYLQEVSARFCGIVATDGQPPKLILEDDQYRYEISLPDIGWWSERCESCRELLPPGEDCPTCDSDPADIAFTTGAALAARQPAHGNTTR